ncbi:GNAT family N-acetyltransferase [Cesiribacter sp. SM1]|uniref:GNAT family N-acetyltransferase n=1 Tax=Cesiribacter sp. SM1 TaxID=2861196 RepID=UPI001CD7276C|nr:GNAT family N-acetyltransferase [Cesiribacter sp. SM1]
MKELLMESFYHSTDHKGGSFYYEIDGKRLAELNYIRAGDHQIIIDHTTVDVSLKGRGIGKRLLFNLVTFVRENHIRVIPLCPFAAATFHKTHEWQNVLA